MQGLGHQRVSSKLGASIASFSPGMQFPKMGNNIGPRIDDWEILLNGLMVSQTIHRSISFLLNNHFICHFILCAFTEQPCKGPWQLVLWLARNVAKEKILRQLLSRIEDFIVRCNHGNQDFDGSNNLTIETSLNNSNSKQDLKWTMILRTNNSMVCLLMVSKQNIDSHKIDQIEYIYIQLNILKDDIYYSKQLVVISFENVLIK